MIILGSYVLDKKAPRGGQIPLKW